MAVQLGGPTNLVDPWCGMEPMKMGISNNKIYIYCTVRRHNCGENWGYLISPKKRISHGIYSENGDVSLFQSGHIGLVNYRLFWSRETY